MTASRTHLAESIKRPRPLVTDVHIGMSDSEWLPIEGVIDVEITSGDFKLESGKIEQGHHVVIHLDHIKFDDGQAALDAALNQKGKLRVRIIGHRRTLLGELQPYDVNAKGGKGYTVSARISDTSWGARP